MKTPELITALEKTATELELQAENVKVAMESGTPIKVNYADFLASITNELGLNE